MTRMFEQFRQELLLIFVTFFVIHEISTSSGVEITIPSRCRTEGRLSFTVPENEQNDPTTSTYHLSFSEAIDSIDDRAVVSVGYVAYEPTKYFMRDGLPPVTVGSDGICTSTQPFLFIPEIAWLLERMIPGDKIVPRFPHLVGPTGLLNSVQKLLNQSKDQFKFDRSVTHRNVPCDIYTKSWLFPDSDLSLKVEIFSPTNGVKFRNLETTYFTVRVSVDDVKNQNIEESKRKSFMIDYYNIESADGVPEKFESMLNDFNLPFGRGCSAGLAHYRAEVTSESFSMKYSQASQSNFILMAYDHLSGYLRKEIIGGSVSIWDLNEDLLYHIDNEIADTFETTTSYKGNAQSCSVMSIVNEGLGPALRPYEVNGESLNVLKMIGASFVTYLGRGTVRDLPCLVYEVILDKPPFVFGLKDEDLSLDIEKGSETKREKDYIVQFHVLEGEKINMKGTTPLPANFWPARIVLYRRYKSLGLIDFIDQLDIFDFYWSLNGWDKKGSELFMASECFDDEDEQIRIELALTFNRDYQNQAKRSDALMLAYNKFKLEFDLLNDIFKLFDVSKMHLVEYELKLRPNHVNLNMIIGDRKEDKKLVYFGEGQLPQSDSYQANRVDFYSLNEKTCVLASSHIPDISLVVYCPSDPTTNSEQSCIAVYNENDPTITTNTQPTDKPACHVYKFEESFIPKRSIETIYTKSNELYRHPFRFEAEIPANKGERSQEKETMEGSIRNYDITHEVKLITVENYSFTIDDDQENINENHSQQSAESEMTTVKTPEMKESDGEKRVRTIDSFHYQNEGDCARMCNLDVTCRSYSYCSSSTKQSNSAANEDYNKNRCILSSFDIRESDLTNQLVHLVLLSPNKQTIVKDNHMNGYKLQFAEGCNIYERDYLNMFRRTDEIIRLDSTIAEQFQMAPTTFDCAKQSVDLEHAQKASNHHIAMFAYCSNSNTWQGKCLLDESLFAVTSKKDTAGKYSDNEKKDKEGKDSSSGEDTDDEILCRVYRKKYQTYFKISGHVFKQNPKQQVELSLGSVEECARACWIRLGQVCASFDYSSTGSCLINTLSVASDDVTLESRPNWLHYERNLSLDELRKQHLIGPHEVYQGDSNSSLGHKLWQIILFIFQMALVVCAFIYGLVLGNQVNDKLIASDQPIVRRLTLAGSNAISSAQQLFGFAGFSSHDDSSLDDEDQINNQSSYGNESRGIQMNVIPRNENERRASRTSGFVNESYSIDRIDVTDKKPLEKDF